MGKSRVRTRDQSILIGGEGWKIKVRNLLCSLCQDKVKPFAPLLLLKRGRVNIFCMLHQYEYFKYRKTLRAPIFAWPHFLLG